MLDASLDPSMGDFAVNVPTDKPGYHPHITLPYLKKRIAEDYGQKTEITYFIVIRNPVDMLWSYFNYFKPDQNSKYNYNQDWDPSALVRFEDWIENGRVGMNPSWKDLAPDFINTSNLSPLSLEAHIYNNNNKPEECIIIKLEETAKYIQIFSTLLGSNPKSKMLHVNQSDQHVSPRLSEDLLSRVRLMFPAESDLYNI